MAPARLNRRGTARSCATLPAVVEVRRYVLYVLAGREDGALLAWADGRLPRSEFEVPAGVRLTAAFRGVLREQWALDGPLLELYVADGGRSREDGSVAVLASVEAPPRWSPPEGGRWVRADAIRADLPPGLHGRAEELLAEWRGEQPCPPLRPAWSRPGWYQRATRWITDRLVEAGRPPTGPIEQFVHWEISAVMRIDTAAGRAWFKAVFPLFAHEPAVTELLSRELPGHVAPVIAADAREGWLLLDDVGSEVVADHPTADPATIRRLVDCQRRFVGRDDALLGVGCRRRPFRALAEELTVALDHPVARDWVDVTDDRREELAAWIEAAATAVAELGFPDTLVHGDFHPENVGLTTEGPVIFDWSDAAVANPLVDAMTWSGWLSRDPERGERAWRTFFEEWADVCPPERVEPHRTALRGLAAAYHTVSYAGILRGLEPSCRADLATGLQQYFAVLDGTVPATRGASR